MNKHILRALALLLTLALSLTALAACRNDEGINESDFKTEFSEEPTNHVLMSITFIDSKGAEQTGKLVLELDPTAAPITVENFKSLVGDGFYNGLTFHRIYKGFMIQGGDPEGDGTGGAAQKIKGEFSANGHQNPISHKRGVISMARGGYSYNSASSQFFIMHADNEGLDGQYAAFGRVVYGMETVDAIASTAVVRNPNSGERSTPITPPVINFARFVTVTGDAVVQ